MSNDRSKTVYRAMRMMYLGISATLMAIGFALVKGWPFDPETQVLGEPLRHWGFWLTVTPAIPALWILVRALVQPGRKTIWWF